MNKAAVITISDKGFAGERVDTSGPALAQLLRQDGWEVARIGLVPDEKEAIQSEILTMIEKDGVSLILTSGGTGLAPRDVTPEATMELLERQVPGISEAMRAYSMQITPNGCLSRGVSGIRGRTLIVNFPGSEKAVRESYPVVGKALQHGVKMLHSEQSAECAAQCSAAQYSAAQSGV